MEAYIWLILASMLAVGVLVGYFMGRNKGDTSAPKVQELEDSVTQVNLEMKQYRSQVTDHFEKTAGLFNQLTNDYRKVYEHLANSSEQLCGDQVAKLKSLTAETKVLEGEGEKVVSQAAEAANETKTIVEDAKTELEAAAADVKTELKAATEEVKVHSEEVLPESETKASLDSEKNSVTPTTDKKTNEARSIH